MFFSEFLISAVYSPANIVHFSSVSAFVRVMALVNFLAIFVMIIINSSYCRATVSTCSLPCCSVHVRFHIYRRYLLTFCPNKYDDDFDSF
jgi:hypothetical protein